MTLLPAPPRLTGTGDRLSDASLQSTHHGIYRCSLKLLDIPRLSASGTQTSALHQQPFGKMAGAESKILPVVSIGREADGPDHLGCLAASVAGVRDAPYVPAEVRLIWKPGWQQGYTVEWAFCRLRQHRAVATRYDKRDFVYRGTVDAAATAIRIWLRDNTREDLKDTGLIRQPQLCAALLGRV